MFKQFALGTGQPYGPETLDGPVIGPATVAMAVTDPSRNYLFTGVQDKTLVSDGQGLFNSFSWTSGTFAGNVFSPSRPGSSQLDNVEIQVLPALDILRGSVRPYQSGGALMQAQFVPLDDQGHPVPLKDLARALGVDHFNWRQTILAVPDSPPTFIIRNVNTPEKVNDVLTKSIFGPITAPVYSDGSPVEVVRLTPQLLNQGALDPLNRPDTYYAGYSESFGWVPLAVNGQENDEFDPYLSETGQSGLAWQEKLIDVIGNSSDYSLLFEDTPRIDRNAFTGQQPYLQFKTELVGVKADKSIVSWDGLGLGTAFKWKTNAKNISDVTVFGVIGGSNADAESGGVFDVFVNDGSQPNAAPVARNDSTATTPAHTVEVSVLANDDNPDFGALDFGSLAVTAGPVNGTVAYNSTTGVVIYTPNDGFIGTDTFRYTVKDDLGAVSNEATVTVRVARPPVAVNDTATTRSGLSVWIDVLANDTDPDGTLDPAAVTVTSPPAHGTFSVNSYTGAIFYTSNFGFVGNDTIGYTAKDLDGTTSAEATITITVTPNLLIAPILHSLHDAEAKLFLDVSGIDPGSETPGVYPVYDTDGDPTTFSDSELTDIQLIWQAVAEDYAPFNLDVTTENPISSPQNRVEYVLIGGGGNGGGVSGVGTFGYYRSISYVFSANFSDGDAASIADAASHEAGHAFGLWHQSKWVGNTKTEEYFNPQGTNWAPLMGNSCYRPLSIWYDGTSSLSPTSTQDDIAIIGGAANNFGFRPDDHGDTAATATQLSGGADRTVRGLVNSSTDGDVFAFTLAAAGPVEIQVEVDSFRANLDAVIDLRDANGNLVASAEPEDSLGAELGRSLPAGAYTVTVRGTGEYGRVGQYTLRVITPGSANAWPKIISQTPSTTPEWTDPALTLTFDQAMETTPLTVDDLFVSYTNPGGDALPSYMISGIEWTDDRTLTVHLGYQYLHGDYMLVLATDRLHSADGLGVDQDGDGTAGVSPGDRYLARFTVGPRLDSYEPNDTADSAYHMSGAASTYATGLTIHRPGDPDYFQFAALGSGSLSVSATPDAGNILTGNLTVTVTDVNGLLLGTSTGSAPVVHTTVVTGSIYYVRIAAAGNSLIDSYDLEVHAPPPGSLNTPPAIYTLHDLTIPGNESSDPIGFLVNDLETPASLLVVTTSSSNTTLIPSSSVAFGGSGGNRTFTISPVHGQTGTATITFTVTDAGGQSASSMLVVTVSAPPLPPQPLSTGSIAVSGSSSGAVTLLSPTSGGQYAMVTGNPNPFPQSVQAIRSATADVNGDGTSDAVFVTGPGTPIRVAVISGLDNSTILVAPFDPFGGDFFGGGFVSSGDFESDGRFEFIVTPDQGGGPRVSIFSLLANGSVQTKANFLGIDDVNFRGGARSALGDVDGDGTPDLLVAAGFGGGPRVAIFDGESLLTTRTKLVNDFFAFPDDATTLRNGIFAALGDISGDGFADLVFGGGPGGAPRVYILSGEFLMSGNPNLFSQPVANFFVAGNSSDRGGVRLAVKNSDGDSKADLVVGSGEGSPAKVRVYLGTNFTGAGEPGTFQDISVFGGMPLTDGVFVG